MYHIVSPTHYHGRVCGIGKERYILWFCYDVGPTELHIDSDRYRVSGREELFAIHLLQRDVRVILRPCTEALRRLHPLCGNACLCEDFSLLRRRAMLNNNYRNIAKTDEKESWSSKMSVRLGQTIWQLLFNDGVDISTALWKDSNYKCRWGPSNPLALLAGSAELLE